MNQSTPKPLGGKNSETLDWFAESHPKESQAINKNMFEFASKNLSVHSINKKCKELLNR